MIENCLFNLSSEPLCICLYLCFAPRSLARFVPARPHWEITDDVMNSDCLFQCDYNLSKLTNNTNHSIHMCVLLSPFKNPIQIRQFYIFYQAFSYSIGATTEKVFFAEFYGVVKRVGALLPGFHFSRDKNLLLHL